ncbi:MAG: phosphatase PAP2 family protein [Candidatus Woesearchaeota archaeon]
MKKSVWYLVALVALTGSFFIDDKLALFFNQHSNAWLTAFFKFFTYIGSGLSAVIPLIIIALWVSKKREYIIPLALGALATLALCYGLKIVAARPRPYESLKFMPMVSHFSSKSFPSLHASMSFSTLPVLLKVFGSLRYFWIAVISLVAFSRVYLGVHYVSDVIAGAMIGYAISDFFMSSMKDKWFRRINFLR